MSMYLLPKTVIKSMDKIRKRFFWQGGGTKKKYYLVKWSKICVPKNMGGLGIKDLRKLNISLLAKWWWKLENGEGLWQDIVMAKYVKKQCLHNLKKKPGNSPSWNDLLKVKEFYLKGRIMIVGNGQSTDFWQDAWCGTMPLKEKFPDLFAICNTNVVSVEGMARNGWRLTFRRWLDVAKQIQYRQLRDMITPLALSNEKDIPKWCWDGRGIFSLKSLYAHLCESSPRISHTNLWRAKLPLKIKIFMWLVEKNSILTRDNLTRRGWHGDKRCNFCLENESVNHLFFDCSMARYVWSLVAYVVGTDCRPCSFDQFWLWAKQFFPLSENFLYVGLAAICWAIWRMRNKIHFDKKVVRSPTEIICLASSFMSFWAELQSEEDKSQLEAGAKALKKAALSFHPQEAQAEDVGVVLLN